MHNVYDPNNNFAELELFGWKFLIARNHKIFLIAKFVLITVFFFLLFLSRAVLGFNSIFRLEFYSTQNWPLSHEQNQQSFVWTFDAFLTTINYTMENILGYCFFLFSAFVICIPGGFVCLARISFSFSFLWRARSIICFRINWIFFSVLCDRRLHVKIHMLVQQTIFIQTSFFNWIPQHRTL